MIGHKFLYEPEVRWGWVDRELAIPATFSTN
jgi:hypothetical protein